MFFLSFAWLQPFREDPGCTFHRLQAGREVFINPVQIHLYSAVFPKASSLAPYRMGALLQHQQLNKAGLSIGHPEQREFSLMKSINSILTSASKNRCSRATGHTQGTCCHCYGEHLFGFTCKVLLKIKTVLVVNTLLCKPLAYPVIYAAIL